MIVTDILERQVIKITFRRTSRLSMRIGCRGDVLVSAPIGMPRRVVDRFITEQEAWIRQALQTKLCHEQRRAEFYNQLSLRTKAEKEEAGRRLMDIVGPMILEYEERMGVRISGVSLKRTISRWGSCNTRSRHICLSFYLLLLPRLCIEHTVVHELAHLLVPNHGVDFYAVMDRYFPRWREARTMARNAIRGFHVHTNTNNEEAPLSE